MEKMKVYESVRDVPKEARKEIKGGRLKGFTDINPMWRIKMLTEQFGMCGVGWFYEIKDKWIETAMAKDEITANVIIDLYVKVGDEWSKPIQGLGGSMLVASERGGMYVDDECYKKALTDAISVACKSLGMGADVYWQNDRTKYEPKGNETPKKKNTSHVESVGDEQDDYDPTAQITPLQAKVLRGLIKDTGSVETDICKAYGVASIQAMSNEQYAHLAKILEKRKESKGKEKQSGNIDI